MLQACSDLNDVGQICVKNKAMGKITGLSKEKNPNYDNRVLHSV